MLVQMFWNADGGRDRGISSFDGWLLKRSMFTAMAVNTYWRWAFDCPR